MSHKETVIDLTEGLTVLVGENNCGKSAIVAAVQTLCQNLSGSYMVRHGEKDCRVKIETANHQYEWRRIKGKVSYCIDGTEIDRLKGSVPEQLHQQLRLPLVDANGEMFDIHFGEQKDPIFLLNKSGSHRAAFFASSSDAGKLLEMQNRHRSNVSAKRKEEKQLAFRSDRLTRKRELLNELPTIDSKLNELEQQFESTKKQDQTISNLKILISQLAKKNASQKQLLRTSVALATIKQPPTLSETNALQTLVQNIALTKHEYVYRNDIQHALKELYAPEPQLPTGRIASLTKNIAVHTTELQHGKEQSLALKKLPTPFSPTPTLLLERLVTTYSQLQKRRQIAQQRAHFLSQCQPPPEFAKSELSHEKIEQMKALQSKVNRLEEAGTSLQDLPAPQPQRTTLALQAATRKQQQIQIQVNELKRLLESTHQLLTKNENNLKQATKDQEFCPTCGQSFDAEVLIAKASVGKTKPSEGDRK